MRASQLELAAHRRGHRGLAARIADAAPDRAWQTAWSHGRPFADHQVLTGHTDRVHAVAVGALPDGTPVIVSGGGDGTVRVWRLADGTRAGEPLTGHEGPVLAVAVGALPDSTPVIVSGGGDGTVRVWRLTDGTPVGKPLDGYDGPVHAVAVGALPDGTPVIVTAAAATSGAGVAADDDAGLGKPLTGDDGSSACGGGGGAARQHTGDRQRRGIDGTVRVWRLADGTPVGEPLTGHAVTR